MKPGCAVLTKQILDSFIKVFQFVILSLTLAAQILDISLLQILKTQKLYLTFLAELLLITHGNFRYAEGLCNWLLIPLQK